MTTSTCSYREAAIREEITRKRVRQRVRQRERASDSVFALLNIREQKQRSASKQNKAKQIETKPKTATAYVILNRWMSKNGVSTTLHINWYV